MILRALFTAICCMLGYMHVVANPLDSVKVTKHKGVLYIIHKVDKGDGLIALARRYNTSVDEIKKANPKLKQLTPGQKINIPLATPAVQNDKNTPDSSKINVDESHANADSKDVTSKMHTVQSGETLYKIAARYKVTVQQIIKWNAIKNNKIEVGQQLIVSGNLSLKSYEKWNGTNSLTAKTDSVKNTLSASTNLVEESGMCVGTSSNTHPTLPIGTFVVCINPDTQKQVLVQIEASGALASGCIIGLSESALSSLGLPTGYHRITIKYNQP